MEVGNDAYSRKFGEGISRQYVLNGSGEGANQISGDLCDPAVLPKEAFDCIILTQTLQFVSDPAEALKNCNAALKPGGTLLMSVPVLSPLIDEQWQFRWLFTGPFVDELLTIAFPASEKEVHSIGNCYAATCIINGVPMEEADQTKLAPVDPERPILVLAKVTKPQA